MPHVWSGGGASGGQPNDLEEKQKHTIIRNMTGTTHTQAATLHHAVQAVDTVD